ncbi:J domain-containing protein [Neisseria montereyensis]|uniref:J domain-containing protein n=1 Tax=Neisseria montereyensis TaxID=2973938 RepID=A0ABT2FC39_9NEIS|nr:J domain-containing protein [Neisseria montereyensis]MCS4533794.1 J domain-containing protein [Neisseria montereyensis]
MSQRIRTHYDNLKVAQDAPIEVIRAAYRSLCKKYHPDQNPNNPDAERIMSLINRSYAVLSDPEQRRAHDDWIAAQSHHHHPTPSNTPKHQPSETFRPSENPPQAQATFTRFWLGLVFFAIILSLLFWFAKQQREAAPAYPTTRLDTHTPATYPEFAQYMPGYPVLAEQGHNMVKIDNQNKHSAVLAQIFPNNSKTAIRTIYIPPQADFTAFKLAAGQYRLHYRQLADDTQEEVLFELDEQQADARVIVLEDRGLGI